MTKKRIKVRSQAEFDACVKDGNIAVVINCSIEAWGNCSIEAWGNCSIEARENCSIEAWGNCSVVARENCSVVARENCSVVAWENCSIEAWENCSVVARENCSVVARENCSIEAWGHVFVRLFGADMLRTSSGVIVIRQGEPSVEIEGDGTIVEARQPRTAAEWCEFHGVDVKDGVATLYKGVFDHFCSDNGYDYTPGTTPVAHDWDGGTRECGGGLHFSPHPLMTHAFTEGRRYLACQVALSDMRAPMASDRYPNKMKARGCCAPVIECDVRGRLLPHHCASDEVTS